LLKIDFFIRCAVAKLPRVPDRAQYWHHCDAHGRMMLPEKKYHERRTQTHLINDPLQSYHYDEKISVVNGSVALMLKIIRTKAQHVIELHFEFIVF
jgi:hypothetical protein